MKGGFNLDSLTIFHFLCAILAGILCFFLTRYYEKDYAFPTKVKISLSLGTLVFSFLFGVLQPQPDSLPTYLEMMLIGPLIFLCSTDIKALELPDGANLLVGCLGFIYLLAAPFTFLSGVSSALILFISFFIIAFVSGGALGGGDIKYVLGFGLWIPTYHILPFLLFATLSASLYGIILLVFSRKKDPLPFGPFLILSSIYLLFLF